jgi:putative flippase GtrA
MTLLPRNGLVHAGRRQEDRESLWRHELYICGCYSARVVLENTDTTSARTAATRRGERYHALMATLVGRLPFGLSRIVAPSFLGFAIINGFTFSVDLGLLSLCHGALKWPYAAAVTLSYLTAFALSFVLNRAFNFRSHEDLGPQTAKYVVAVGINYAVFVVGLGSGLTAMGVEYQLARVLSGLCEGVYMYCVMRWVVFRDASARDRSIIGLGAAHPGDSEVPAAVGEPGWLSLHPAA